MDIKEIRDREECKKYLLEFGIDPELLKKPAIFERCFEEYLNSKTGGVFHGGYFNPENGIFTVGKLLDGKMLRKVDIASGGITYSGNYTESSRYGDFTDVTYNSTLTEEGLIKLINMSWSSMGPLDYSPDNHEKIESIDNMLGNYVDFGFISYKDFLDNRVSLSSANYYKKEKFSLDELMALYDEHHKKVVELYPELDGYYKSKREAVMESAKRYSRKLGNQSRITEKTSKGVVPKSDKTSVDISPTNTVKDDPAIVNSSESPILSEPNSLTSDEEFSVSEPNYFTSRDIVEASNERKIDSSKISHIRAMFNKFISFFKGDR